MAWDRFPTDYLNSAGVATTFEPVCSGHSFLSDGRLLVCGGEPFNTVRGAWKFDPAAEIWERTAGDMGVERWYPTVVSLGDDSGRALVASGVYNAATPPLMEIYSPELVTTQQEYLMALETYRQVAESPFSSVKENAEKILKSTRQRLEYWDIPPAEIERLEQTGEVKKTVLLRAPANGIVVHKNAIEGAYIKAGMDLYRIADLRTVWVHASIYDDELPWIAEGQRATMELSYLPGQAYQGQVSYIYPFLRKKARDVHVRLIFPNPDLALKPGMYVNVELQGRNLPNTLVIPAEAVIRSGERTIVFVVRAEGKFEPRELQIGEEGGPAGGYVRVLSGLLDHEQVVTSAQFMLDSESRLQEAIQKMLLERTQSAPQPVLERADAMPEMEAEEQNEHQ